MVTMKSRTFSIVVTIFVASFTLLLCSDEVNRGADEINEYVLESEKVSQSYSTNDPQTEAGEETQSLYVHNDNGDVRNGDGTDILKQSDVFIQIVNGEPANHQDIQGESDSLRKDNKDVVQGADKSNLEADETSSDKTTDGESHTPQNPEDVKDVDSGMKDEEGADLMSNPSENKDVQNNQKDTEGSAKKQRYFPLLYTFGSLFTSFLADFGDVSSSSDTSSSVGNSSQLSSKNTSSVDGLLEHLNSTSNSTEQGKRTRFQCSLHLKNSTTETVNATAKVSIINSTELLEILNFSKNQKTSPCVLVMFYTKWCQFSARVAPEYNALARAFPQLDILAVDTSHFSYLNAKFGTVAVPNIMLFHSRSAVRFNHTTRDLENFMQFVTNNTGLDAVPLVTVLPEDFEGPLSSQVVQGRDWLLWLAWTFILVCSIYGFFFSLYGQAIMGRLRVLWQEHQHIE